MDYDSYVSLPAMFYQNTAEIGDRAFLWSKTDGEWQPVSGNAARSQSGALSGALAALGISAGDRVVLLSESRPEWMIADLAIMSLGAICVPAYTTNKVSDHLHILKDSGARGVIVSGPNLARNLLPAAREAGIEFVIAMDPLGDSAGEGDVACYAWEELLGRHENYLPDVSGIRREDTSCLIYTSGTGGTPKGVMLSHGAIISNCKGAHRVISELGLGDEVFLSFLPLSHSYEHTAGLMFPLSIKAQIYYAEGLDRLAANMVEARPTIMTAVPRLYETMHGRILRGIRQKGGVSEKLFMKAVENGRRRYENAPLSITDRMLDPLLDKLVRSKVSERFGGRLKAIVSGGAPLDYEIGVFFQALGLLLVQGYGMTEAAPVISCNLPSRNKMKTVGPPVVDVEVRIADDGEILVRGELLMQGYWNRPDETAETIIDGWLHTGDVGEFDEDGHLVITDRKKDIIVNSGGDNISPQRVEGFLTRQPEISQAMVIGDRKPYLVALIVPDPDFAAEWAEAGGHPADLSSLIKEDGFRKAISDAVNRINVELSVIERVRNFILMDEEFTIENEMMTPSLKIRRHVIKDRYGEALEGLYA